MVADDSALTNPLASPEQLLALRKIQNSAPDIETTLFELFLITQNAGYLLELPQEVIASSIVLQQRYLVSEPKKLEAGVSYSFENFLLRSSAAAIYLAAKQSFYPVSPRSTVNVFSLICSPLSPLKRNSDLPEDVDAAAAKTFYVSEGTFQRQREQLFDSEKALLASAGFQTRVVLPHSIALTYLSVFGVHSEAVIGGVVAYLNTGLISPQLLYLTHQPNALAVAAIYLVAREQDLKLVDDGIAWWSAFDVSQEELGFLVLSLASLVPIAENMTGRMAANSNPVKSAQGAEMEVNAK